MVAPAHPGVGGHFERLEVALAFNRLKTDGAELAGNVIRRFLELRRSGSAPAHVGGGQVFDVLQIPLRIDAAVFRGRRRCSNRREKQNTGEIRKKAAESAHVMS